jgi:hypothetical protein
MADAISGGTAGLLEVSQDSMDLDFTSLQSLDYGLEKHVENSIMNFFFYYYF